MLLAMVHFASELALNSTTYAKQGKSKCLIIPPSVSEESLNRCLRFLIGYIGTGQFDTDVRY